MSSSTLAMAQAKSTPIKQITPAGVKESPGNWKHPRLSEITRRQNKTIFSEKNIRQIIYNALALVGVVSLRQVVLPLVPAVLFGPTVRKYNGWLTFALVLIPLINIGFALLPLFRAKDDLRDIPLTPAQRKLLGLPPSTRPETPNSVYSTPPRYSRTPSLAGSPLSIKSYTSSPLSNIASPSPYSASNLSPSKFNTSQYSPSAVSPLLHKAFAGGVQRPTYGSPSPIGGKRGGTVGLPRTSSYGSPSPLGASTSAYRYNASITSSVCDDEFATPGTPTTPTTPSTPTPTTGKRSSVSLNSKWLYEKGRRNSSSSWLHQNLS